MAEKLEALMGAAVVMALGGLALALFLWGAAILLFQCSTWLRVGLWQPVPAYALLMTERARDFDLRMTERQASPLDLAPSLGSYASFDAAQTAIAGKMVGLRRIVAWLLDIGLVGWLWGLALLSFMLLVAVGKANYARSKARGRQA